MQKKPHQIMQMHIYSLQLFLKANIGIQNFYKWIDLFIFTVLNILCNT